MESLRRIAGRCIEQRRPQLPCLNIGRLRCSVIPTAMVLAVLDMTYALILLAFYWRVVFEQNYHSFTVCSALKCAFTACFMSFLWPFTQFRLRHKDKYSAPLRAWLRPRLRLLKLMKGFLVVVFALEN